MTVGTVGAATGGLAALADGLAADRRELLAVRDRVRWATDVAAGALPGGAQAAVDGTGAVRRLGAVAEQLDGLRRGVRLVEEELLAADRTVWPGIALQRWWRTGSAGVRWLDDLMSVDLDEVPGVAGTAAPALCGAIHHGWAAARAVDAATGGRVARGLDGVTGPARTRIDRAAAAAARLVGGTRVATIGARVADVLRAPLVRSTVRTVGRIAGVVGVVVDGVEAVDRARDGDGWGAARSAATALGGAVLLVTSNPVAVAVATVVVAGVYVYEHREAIAGSARTAWDRGTGAVRRATSRISGGTPSTGHRVSPDLLAGARWSAVGLAAGG